MENMYKAVTRFMLSRHVAAVHASKGAQLHQAAALQELQL